MIVEPSIERTREEIQRMIDYAHAGEDMHRVAVLALDTLNAQQRYFKSRDRDDLVASKLRRRICG
jgi:hypothetical protein